MCSVATAGAQTASTGTVQGTVLDALTGEPLVAVNVMVEGTPYGTLTGRDGTYLLPHIPTGEHVLRYSYVGYRTLRMERVVVLPALRTRVDVRLEATALDLPPLVVTADRPLIQRDITGTLHRVSAISLATMPVDRVQDMLELQPGVVAGGHIRGGRSDETLFVLDGLPLQDPTAGGAAAGIPRTALTELNIHTGGFDVEFGNALSGVVHMITRRGDDRYQTHLLYSRDDLGALAGGTEHSGRRHIEGMHAGPLLKNRLYYLAAVENVQEDTRWWQDFERSPLPRPWSNYTNAFARTDYYASPALRLTGEMLSSHMREQSYEWRWRFNLEGLPENRRRSDRLSLSIHHLLGPSLFYDLQLALLRIDHAVGLTPPEELAEGPLWRYDSYLQYVIGGDRLWWYRGNQLIRTGRGSLTAHLGPHTLKAGFEAFFHDLSSALVKFEPQTTFYGMPRPEASLLNYSTDYRYYPRRGALFIQDTYEGEDGFIVKVGLRYDWLDPRAQRPVVEWVPATTTEFTQEVTAWVPATVKTQLSPRLGVAVPFADQTWLLFNVGLFFQVPLFDQLYSGLDLDLTRGLRVLVGNPDLKHQRTKAYEMGIRRGFHDDLAGALTFFYKESRHLIDTKTFLAADSRALEDGFTQYVNLPLAQSSGLEVSVEQRPTHLPGGRLAYSYMVARGHADTGTSGLRYLQWGFEPTRYMHYLSWDQRHTLSVEVMGRHLGLDYHLLGRYASPRPYTYAPSASGVLPREEIIEPNNARMESTAQVDLRLTRSRPLPLAGSPARLVFFFDVRNLTDRRNILWMSSDGRVGGELGDPGALSIGRRTRVGLEVRF